MATLISRVESSHQDDRVAIVQDLTTSMRTAGANDSFEAALMLPEAIPMDELGIFELMQNYERQWNMVLDRLEECPELARMPIRQSSSVYDANQNAGNTMLHHCGLCLAPLEVVEELMAIYPLALTIPNDQGLLPLHVACLAGASLSVIDALIQAHPAALTHQATSTGMLPLHCALQVVQEGSPVIGSCLSSSSSDEEQGEAIPVGLKTQWFPPVLHLLLTHYPQGMEERDGCGKNAQDYLAALSSSVSKHPLLEHYEVVRVLDQARPWIPTAVATEKRVRSLLQQPGGGEEEGGKNIFTDPTSTSGGDEFGGVLAHLAPELKAALADSNKRTAAKKRVSFTDLDVSATTASTEYSSLLDVDDDDESEQEVQLLLLQVEQLRKEVAVKDRLTRALQQVILDTNNNVHASSPQTGQSSSSACDITIAGLLPPSPEVIQLRKSNALKDRLLQRITGMAKKQKETDQARIVELADLLQEQTIRLTKLTHALAYAHQKEDDEDVMDDSVLMTPLRTNVSAPCSPTTSRLLLKKADGRSADDLILSR